MWKEIKEKGARQGRLSGERDGVLMSGWCPRQLNQLRWKSLKSAPTADYGRPGPGPDVDSGIIPHLSICRCPKP